MIGSIASRMAGRMLCLPPFREDAVLIRASTGTFAAGRFDPTQPARIPIKVTAAGTDSERETQPGGLRENPRLTFYLREPVTAIVEGESAGDAIEYGGETYQLIEVHDWGAFFEALGVIQ